MKKALVNQWGVAVLFIVLCVGGCARTDRDLIRREALTYSVIFQAIMFSHSGRHVALLLDAGAGINVRDKGGDTPVMRAVTARGDYRLVWALLQRGANWKIKAKDGRSLVDIIPIRGINPDGDQVAWREKVMAFIDEDHTGDCAGH